MAMSVPMARAAMLNLLVHLFHSLPVTPHNISDMSYPVKVDLKLINLPQNVVKAGNLSICHRNRIACSVVLLLHYSL